MSWGKHHASMYEGSMRGKGSPFFAVWGYIISHMKPNRTAGSSRITEMTVELNPELIGFMLGEKVEVVAEKIDEMCQPDLKSRTPDNDGRKLVKRGEYSYLVVNGLFYRTIRNEDERREYQRVKQAEYRENKSKRRRNGNPLKRMADPGGAISAQFKEREKRYVEAENDGNQVLADSIAAEGLK
jgi:hypothetical protein